MNPTADISIIYDERTARYNRISVSTISSVFKGKQAVRTVCGESAHFTLVW